MLYHISYIYTYIIICLASPTMRCRSRIPIHDVDDGVHDGHADRHVELQDAPLTEGGAPVRVLAGEHLLQVVAEAGLLHISGVLLTGAFLAERADILLYTQKTKHIYIY